MSERRFATFSIDQLEKLFDDSRKQLDVLETLAGELSHRKSKRANDLKQRVVQAMATFGKMPPPIEDELWYSYEQSLTDEERAYILRSPALLDSVSSQNLSLWNQGLEVARQSEHTLVPHVARVIAEGGLGLKVNSDAYGLALRLAAFEIRNKCVTRWPVFALLFRKILGEGIIAWLPSLYLAAHAMEPQSPIREELDEVLAFRDQFAKGA
jgi:hypothetical protein